MRQAMSFHPFPGILLGVSGHSAPSRLNDDHPQRHLVPAKPTAAVGQLSGDLVVMAALIGISRAFFGRRSRGPVKRFLGKAWHRPPGAVPTWQRCDGGGPADQRGGG